MTKKELLCEYRELLEASGISRENVRSVAPDTFLRKSKEDLERCVHYARIAADATARKRARDEYFMSSEGSARKAEIEARLEEIAAECERVRRAVIDEIDREFHEKFPEVTGYHVVDVDSGYTSRVLLSTGSTGVSAYYRAIEICYGDNITTINPSAIGAVKVADSTPDTDYFITLGKLFERRISTVTLMHHAIERYSEGLSDLREEARALKKELDNPVNI